MSHGRKNSGAARTARILANPATRILNGVSPRGREGCGGCSLDNPEIGIPARSPSSPNRRASVIVSCSSATLATENSGPFGPS